MSQESKLWEIEITSVPTEVDREAARILSEAEHLGLSTIQTVSASRSFLIEGAISAEEMQGPAARLLADPVTERWTLRSLPESGKNGSSNEKRLSVLFKPGVTDNVGSSTLKALQDLGLKAELVATCRKYHFSLNAQTAELERLSARVLANDAIEHVIEGALPVKTLHFGHEAKFELRHIAIRDLNDDQLMQLSKEGQLYLQLAEMQTIRQAFRDQGREPTDIELETIAQTWSEHCSHKTLKGRVRYTDENGTREFQNLLKETVFGATVEIRKRLGDKDWCVSVFQDNAGVVTFNEKEHVCFKVETHNHPSAIEPYGGANTGLGGVIRDPIGTGMGAKPICNTDVFCFAPPETPYDSLPPGTLHPKMVARGVVSGVRDYGNRMGIPTVNGSVFFDDRYLGNPLVFCGNVAMLPVGMENKQVSPGDLIVAVGGRTGRDGIHGATFSSAELTEESETISGGAVQIGNAITEKMVLDVILDARDRGLYSAITDCGAGGFSSAVGEMGAECGAEVWLEKCPLKYAGLTYTEIWISEAQERMVLSVPPAKWEAFRDLCAAEGVEATNIGVFTDTGRLLLKYHGEQVGEVSMHFLHDGRPPVIRAATYQPPKNPPLPTSTSATFDTDLLKIIGSLNVCSKEWIIRQYDHEVQAGSVVKPLVGASADGPSDAAVVRPHLTHDGAIAISNGMNPRYGDYDPYWMAASAIDEAVRNCVAVGADPAKIAILDNFCWGNTERPETLGSLVRAALACKDVALAFGTPFISGKDSLNNEFSYMDKQGVKQTVAIPSSLLISALGQLADFRKAVTMDFKQAGNLVFLVGATKDELGGSHYTLVNNLQGGEAPRVDLKSAPKVFRAVHQAIESGLVRACHDLSEGGLAVAAAEMSLAGHKGADLDLREVQQQSGLSDPAVTLFSESNSRFLVEVEPANRKAFEDLFAGLPLSQIGTVSSNDRLRITSGADRTLVNQSWGDLKKAWQNGIDWE